MASAISVSQADPIADPIVDDATAVTEEPDTEELGESEKTPVDDAEDEAAREIGDQETDSTAEINQDDGEEENLPSTLDEFLQPNSLSLGQSRAGNSAVTRADPRYTCGLTIGLLFDASGSTKGEADKMVEATRNIADVLHNTGSSLGIHTYAAKSPSTASLPHLPPTYLDDAGFATANAHIDRLGSAWGQGSEALGGSNMAEGLIQMQNLGYDLVILISDGIAYKANRVNTFDLNRNGIFDEDLNNSIAAAEALKAQGTALFSIVVGSGSDKPKIGLQVYNSQPQTNNKGAGVEWHPSNKEQVPGTSKAITRRANGTVDLGSYRIIFNGNIRTVSANQMGPVTAGADGGLYVKFNNGTYLVYTRWVLDPAAFMASFSDYQEEVYDTNAVADALENMVSGCNGLVTIEKEIVEVDGTTSSDTPKGFAFTANQALINGDLNSNVVRTTDARGEVQYYYPISAGAASITVREDPTRDGETFTMVNQNVGNNRQSIARCTATDAHSNPLPVSYGSGNGIVVYSDSSRNQFRITGLGRDDRVRCVVQNQKPAEVSFKATKSAPNEQLVLSQEDGQRLSARFDVSVENLARTAGAPTEITEQPRVPTGTTVERVRAMPTEGGDQVVTSEAEFTWDSSRRLWVLSSSNSTLEEIPGNTTANMYVLVTYRVTSANSLNTNNRTCSGSNQNRGFFNRVTVYPGEDASNTARGTTDTACLSAIVPQLKVQRWFNGEVANSPDEAAVISPTTNSYQQRYVITNAGEVPINNVTFRDYRLRNEDQSRGDAVSLYSPVCPTPGTVSRSTNRAGTYITIDYRSGSTLAPGENITCEQVVRQAERMPAEADFYGAEIEVVARYAVPAFQTIDGDEVWLTATDPAWIMKMPAAVGVMPSSGGNGIHGYLFLGLGMILGGIGWTAYRTKKTS
ncbi:MAG: vWA domain-containing protein [Corynebacterium sp.]|nr:vWA domain-containing protein [Corynebacterium sp.]